LQHQLELLGGQWRCKRLQVISTFLPCSEDDLARRFCNGFDSFRVLPIPPLLALQTLGREPFELVLSSDLKFDYSLAKLSTRYHHCCIPLLLLLATTIYIFARTSRGVQVLYPNHTEFVGRGVHVLFQTLSSVLQLLSTMTKNLSERDVDGSSSNATWLLTCLYVSVRVCTCFCVNFASFFHVCVRPYEHFTQACASMCAFYLCVCVCASSIFRPLPVGSQPQHRVCSWRSYLHSCMCRRASEQAAHLQARLTKGKGEVLDATTQAMDRKSRPALVSGSGNGAAAAAGVGSKGLARRKEMEEALMEEVRVVRGGQFTG
jgi:hypothetical protein